MEDEWGFCETPKVSQTPNPHTRIKLITCRVWGDLAAETESRPKYIYIKNKNKENI